MRCRDELLSLMLQKDRKADGRCAERDGKTAKDRLPIHSWSRRLLVGFRIGFCFRFYVGFRLGVCVGIRFRCVGVLGCGDATEAVGIGGPAVRSFQNGIEGSR